jgi:AcrR family transcriptional regulator
VRSRQKIITAALRLIEEGGFQAVNVAAVAEEAAVSRQTVYSIFGSRGGLISEALIEVAQDWSHEIRKLLAPCPDAHDYIVELIVAGRALCRAHPVLAGLLVAESGNPLFDDDTMLKANAAVTDLLAGAVERDPRLGPVLDEVAEIVTRMTLSVVLFDSDRVRSDDDLRGFLRQWLLPALSLTTIASSTRV